MKLFIFHCLSSEDFWWLLLELLFLNCFKNVHFKKVSKVLELWRGGKQLENMMHPTSKTEALNYLLFSCWCFETNDCHKLKSSYPCTHLVFWYFRGGKADGLVYRDFACLGFGFFVPAIGYETWGALVIDRVLLEIKLVFVFQCYMLVYWGGKKEPAKTKWYWWKKENLIFNGSERQSP